MTHKPTVNVLKQQKLFSRLAFASIATLCAAMLPVTLFAAPTVEGNTLSWPDDGWYQVQLAGDYESDVCQGGTSCYVESGTYTVINHSTGERWTDIVVSDSAMSTPGMSLDGPVVMGNTISWQDNGWYQVQNAGDYTSDVCQGGTSCEVAAGTYVVINLTTGMRYENVVVAGDMPNIVETAVAAGGFNTLVAALQATGLDSVLADESSTFTVFAPTDDAFAALGSDTINALIGDTETLSDILLYHVIAGATVDSTTAVNLAGSNVATANGDDVAVSLRGEGLYINDSQVIVADINTSNGVIHVIDAVLIPPADTAPADMTESGSESASGTIMEVAEAAGSFDTLLAAVRATGLDGALGHPGDTYTVFAPTDAAFEALGSETISALLADPDTLRNILAFHVIPGTIFQAADFMDILGIDIGAGNGGILNVSSMGDGLAVNGVSIVAADIPATNGVIHVIDAVLIP